MKKIGIIVGIIVLCFIGLALFFTLRFNQDEQNKLARKSIEYLDGNYLVTFATGNTSRTWSVRNGKVTTSDKNYYFFWDDKGHYIQVPVEHSIIEEVK